MSVIAGHCAVVLGIVAFMALRGGRTGVLSVAAW